MLDAPTLLGAQDVAIQQIHAFHGPVSDFRSWGTGALGRTTRGRKCSGQRRSICLKLRATTSEVLLPSADRDHNIADFRSCTFGSCSTTGPCHTRLSVRFLQVLKVHRQRAMPREQQELRTPSFSWPWPWPRTVDVNGRQERQRPHLWVGFLSISSSAPLSLANLKENHLVSGVW